MKKILLSSMALIIFSLTILIFQMSCQKTAVAQNSSLPQSINKILLAKTSQLQIGTVIDSVGHSTPTYRTVFDYYLMEYDGSNITKININLPQGVYTNGYAILSPSLFSHN